MQVCSIFIVRPYGFGTPVRMNHRVLIGQEDSMDYTKFKDASPELIKRAAEAKSIDELVALLTENGYSVNEEEAKTIFDRLKEAGSGELSDDDLGGVNGGTLFICGAIKKLFVDSPSQSSSSC